MNIHATLPGQIAYDDMIPPEDPPEAPDMDGEIGDLMCGDDTDLVTADEFKESAEEALFELPGLRPLDVINLILAACRSNDIVMQAYSKRLRKALEGHAGEMLDEAWLEAVKRHQRHGDEP